MPAALTYPGVYIQELSSGTHTITGVATSIGAFFGQASMGPTNTAIRCLGYADYARVFGPPVAGTNLAQSVQQFFNNGGADSYIVRLAHGAIAAQIFLNDIAGLGQVLQLTASSPGVWGAGLSVMVDYNTPTPDSTFNLQVKYTTPTSVVSESFSNLSMDPAASRYAPTYIQQSSELLNALPGALATTKIVAGYSESRGLPATTGTNPWNAALQSVWPASDQGSFLISADGGPWTTVNLSKHDLANVGSPPTDAQTWSYIAAQINAALGAASGTSVSVAAPTAGFWRITSASAAASSVQLRMAPSNDLALPLMLGVNQGGIEVARYADLRPVPNGIFFAGDKTANPAGYGQIGAAIDALAAATPKEINNVKINSVSVATGFTSTTAYYVGSGGPGDNDGVRENLQLLADFINAQFQGYQATLAGYRLAIQNLNPSLPQTSDTLTITTVAGSKAAAFAGQFISNVASYSLASTTVGPYATAGGTPSDGTAPTVSDYLGSALDRSGFYALDGVDLFNIMVLPGDGILSEAAWGPIRGGAAKYCQDRRAFLVLDAPLSWTKNNLPNVQASDVANFRGPIGDPDINCAVYFPRVQINDNGTLRYVGASGMVAGMYAATDAARGVWKAPAGTNAALNGVQTLEVILSDRQQGVLNPLAVNCLRRMPAGYVIWGARTVKGFDNSGDSDWTYVPVRRFALFLEESLYRGTQWVVFEPNDEPLWAQIRMNIGAFMMGLFRQGAFQGTTPAQAYFVKCDSQTTTQADINNGIVNILVGFAPLKPAEFVVITIQQIADGLS